MAGPDPTQKYLYKMKNKKDRRREKGYEKKETNQARSTYASSVSRRRSFVDEQRRVVKNRHFLQNYSEYRNIDLHPVEVYSTARFGACSTSTVAARK